MRRYIVDSRLAKWLLFPSCHTITLGCFIFTKKKELSEKTKRHETIHMMQWMEVTIAALIVLGLMSWLVSPYWMVASPLVYYVWYVMEWLVRLPFGNAYRNISFEREAFANDEDGEYIVNRELFNFVKYVKDSNA